ncbi:L-serine ammonia-lyase, iron-sulfur-dependent, subunit beta [Anaerotruncus sp. AF02-27]|nr:MULTISPECIES: L-serine ammonia-lyase, iron-sulfur-dependent subunit beta [Anaerotruncus]RGX55568.1 L-serine ammonia-lyase, iron-sulfur-dependent, subunit beta [Anaerotruncus sp. AF02-27]
MKVFDIVGPVMIGPSSSHTAGAARIGRIAYALLGEKAVRADIRLHGSFAKTYKGHGTDKALVAGIMGMKPDDPRIRKSLELAKEQGLEVSIRPEFFENAHPNTALIILIGENGGQVRVQGASVGGGNILITEVNGMPVEITGQYATLIVLHRDAPGTIAQVTELIASLGVNICNFRLSREQKGGTAVMTIEVDGQVGKELNACIRQLPNVIGSTMLQPI